MELVEAALSGLLVGISLGLTGGGGSILAVPLLIYWLDFPLRAAVTVSLAVVGVTALYGAVLQSRSGLVLWRAGAIIGAGGILAAPFGAALGLQLSDALTLVLFAGLMLFIGIGMLRGGTGSDTILSRIACAHMPGGLPKFSLVCAGKLLLAGLLVGLLSGLFGVGGGFLVVPAILITTAVSIERALATSLVAIALTAASGLAANYGALSGLDPVIPAVFLAGALTGLTAGSWGKRFIPAAGLRRGFAVVVILTGLTILLKEWIF